MTHLVVQVKRLADSDLPLPAYQTEGAAGMDLYAEVRSAVTIEPGAIVLVPTGIALAIPQGWEGQIRPRSGLAVRHGVTLPNAPATIDSDYRGELLVPLINLGTKPFDINRGTRIAQLVFAKVGHAGLTEVKDLPASARDAGGFGHTGA